MENREDSNNKMVEFLWIEINRAILGSSKVKSTLANLKTLGLLNKVSEYNLVVDVNKLIEMMLDKQMGAGKMIKPQRNADKPQNDREQGGFSSDELYKNQQEFDGFSMEENPFFSEDSEEPKAQESEAETVNEPRQFIDGKPLTRNQILFQEYQEQLFDADAWLKKAGIRF